MVSICGGCPYFRKIDIYIGIFFITRAYLAHKKSTATPSVRVSRYSLFQSIPLKAVVHTAVVPTSGPSVGWLARFHHR